MNYLRCLPALLAVVTLGVGAARVEAGQRRGPRNSGAVGAAVPRGSVAPRPATRPVIISPRIVTAVPYRPYYYGYRPGFSVGFYAGYPYGYYPYPYAQYGYYSRYGYPYPPAGYVTATPSVPYGSVRIEGAPRDAQVFADGYYVGVVDDFDGVFQHVNLAAGPHRLEIRAPGRPTIEFDVRVEPGRTITYRAN